MMRISTLPKYEAILRTWLRKYTELRGKPPEGFVYAGAHDFVLRHGKFYRPRLFPKSATAGAPRQCFANAILRACTHGWKYVEGFALEPKLSIDVHHAWNADQQGRLIDITWRNTGKAYMGVEFAVERAEDAMWRETAILDDYKSKWALFKEPWRGERRWEPNPRVEMLRAGKLWETLEVVQKQIDMENGK
jgi:hypothetical protein